MDDFNMLIKIITLGDSGVGKTNLLSRFSRNEFNPESKSTIGVEFLTQQINTEFGLIKAQLWDTAGQERYRALTKSYYTGAQGAIIVFDLTRTASFKNLEKWFSELNSFGSDGIIALLVGNKKDLESERAISANEAFEFAKQKNCAYIETSAKSAENVANAFEKIARQICDSLKQKKNDTPQSTPKPFETTQKVQNDTNDKAPEEKKRGSCC